MRDNVTELRKHLLKNAYNDLWQQFLVVGSNPIDINIPYQSVSSVCPKYRQVDKSLLIAASYRYVMGIDVYLSSNIILF